MIVIEEADLTSIKDFPLKWRWTDPNWNELPADALNLIQPFTESKARELAKYSLTFCDAKGLFDSQFDQISTIDTQTNSSDVRTQLLAWSADLNQKVIVSWDHQHAALIGWEVFTEYWDDFCYPTSDDVAVWPLSNEWALTYLHSEVFVFGHRLHDNSDVLA